ncbi:MAG: hypothetical protein AAFR38_00560 [Planctomycetota bacterium]
MTTAVPEPSTEVRPLSRVLGEACVDGFAALDASPVVQGLLQGTLPRESYASWVAAMHAFDRELDGLLIGRRDEALILATTAGDSRLHGPLGEPDLHDLGIDRGAVALPEAAARFFEGLRAGEAYELMSAHFARSALRNAHRYLAAHARRTFGFEDREGTRLLDPYGLGQRALWERFRRDVDRHRLHDDDLEKLKTRACDALAALLPLHEPEGVASPAETRPVLATL